MELDQLGPGVEREAEQGCAEEEQLSSTAVSWQIHGELYTPVGCNWLPVHQIDINAIDFHGGSIL